MSARRAASGRSHGGWLLAAGIVLLAANLRAAVASVGPVLVDLSRSLSLGGAATAALTTVPVLCFGALAPLAPRLARRFGMERTLAGVLGVLAASLLLRVAFGAPLLFAATVSATGAIAIGNVLVPALVKRDYPGHTGPMMGAYTTALNASAAVAAAVTVPVSSASGWGWRGGLAVWAVPALLALIVWSPQLRDASVPDPPPRRPLGPLLRHPTAWAVTAFLGLQSLAFYTVLAWLPTIYRDAGHDAASAGLLLSIATLVGMPVALFVPSLAVRPGWQAPFVIAFTAAIGGGYLGLLLAPAAAPVVWSILLGIGLGASFPLALTFVILRTTDPDETARLSALAQTVGYLIAAAGPFTVGVLHDVAASWRPPLVLLLALLAPQVVAGLRAAAAEPIGEREKLPEYAAQR